MKASWVVEGETWTLSLSLERDDPIRGPGQGSMSVGLLAREVVVKLPRRIAPPHPDLMIFAAFIIARPWVGNRFVMPNGGVSQQVATEMYRLFNVEVGPVLEGLEPRRPGQRTILAFSGGADSIAAAELLPEGTPHVHFRRVAHPRVPNRAVHVRTDAIEAVVLEAERRGREVEIVRTDLEYMCHPYPTLPHWFGIALGCLLMADDLGADGIAMGGTFETFFMDMGRKWSGQPGAGLDAVPALMGVPLIRPVSGATEIGTMKLAMQSDLADISRSCVIGTYEAPCYQCTKCLRKELTTAALAGGRKFPDSLIRLTSTSAGVKQVSGKPPYYMQAQLEYALARLDLPDGIFADLYTRLGTPELEATSWMERYYGPAADITIPSALRPSVLDTVERRLGLMETADIDSVMAWER